MNPPICYSGWSQQTDQRNVYKTNLMLQLSVRKGQEVFFLSMCNWTVYAGLFCYLPPTFSRSIWDRPQLRKQYQMVKGILFLRSLSGMSCSYAQTQNNCPICNGKEFFILVRLHEEEERGRLPFGKGRRSGWVRWKVFAFACTWELSLHSGLSMACQNKFLIIAGQLLDFGRTCMFLGYLCSIHISPQHYKLTG